MIVRKEKVIKGYIRPYKSTKGDIEHLKVKFAIKKSCCGKFELLHFFLL